MTTIEKPADFAIVVNESYLYLFARHSTNDNEQSRPSLRFLQSFKSIPRYYNVVHHNQEQIW